MNTQPKNGVKAFFTESSFSRWIGEDSFESRLAKNFKAVGIALSIKSHTNKENQDKKHASTSESKQENPPVPAHKHPVRRMARTIEKTRSTEAARNEEGVERHDVEGVKSVADGEDLAKSRISELKTDSQASKNASGNGNFAEPAKEMETRNAAREKGFEGKKTFDEMEADKHKFASETISATQSEANATSAAAATFKKIKSCKSYLPAKQIEDSTDSVNNEVSEHRNEKSQIHQHNSDINLEAELEEARNKMTIPDCITAEKVHVKQNITAQDVRDLPGTSGNDFSAVQEESGLTQGLAFGSFYNKVVNESETEIKATDITDEQGTAGDNSGDKNCVQTLRKASDTISNTMQQPHTRQHETNTSEADERVKKTMQEVDRSSTVYNKKNRTSYGPELFNKRPKKKSSLTQQDQKQYLELCSKYSQDLPESPSKQQRQEIQKYQELQRQVKKEQKNFMSYLRYVSRSCVKDYLYIHPEAGKYIEAKFLNRKRRVLTYPRFYQRRGIIDLPDATADTGLVLQYVRPLLQLGIVAKLVLPELLPGMPQPCLPLSFSTVNTVCPSVRPVQTGPFVWNHEEISRDVNAEQLAVPNKCDIVMTASAIKHMVDNQGRPTCWQIPVTVREYVVMDGNKQTIHKVVYIDKPFVDQSGYSGRDKNQMYQSRALQSISLRPKQRMKTFSNICPVVTEEQQPSMSEIEHHLDEMKVSVEKESDHLHQETDDSEVAGTSRRNRKGFIKAGKQDGKGKGKVEGKKKSGFGLFDAEQDIDDLETFGTEPSWKHSRLKQQVKSLKNQTIDKSVARQQKPRMSDKPHAFTELVPGTEFSKVASKQKPETSDKPQAVSGLVSGMKFSEVASQEKLGKSDQEQAASGSSSGREGGLISDVGTGKVGSESGVSVLENTSESVTTVGKENKPDGHEVVRKMSSDLQSSNITENRNLNSTLQQAEYIIISDSNQQDGSLDVTDNVDNANKQTLSQKNVRSLSEKMKQMSNIKTRLGLRSAATERSSADGVTPAIFTASGSHEDNDDEDSDADSEDGLVIDDPDMDDAGDVQDEPENIPEIKDPADTSVACYEGECNEYTDVGKPVTENIINVGDNEEILEQEAETDTLKQKPTAVTVPVTRAQKRRSIETTDSPSPVKRALRSSKRNMADKVESIDVVHERIKGIGNSCHDRNNDRRGRNSTDECTDTDSKTDTGEDLWKCSKDPGTKAMVTRGRGQKRELVAERSSSVDSSVPGEGISPARGRERRKTRHSLESASVSESPEESQLPLPCKRRREQQSIPSEFQNNSDNKIETQPTAENPAAAPLSGAGHSGTVQASVIPVAGHSGTVQTAGHLGEKIKTGSAIKTVAAEKSVEGSQSSVDKEKSTIQEKQDTNTTFGEQLKEAEGEEGSEHVRYPSRRRGRPPKQAKLNKEAELKKMDELAKAMREKVAKQIIEEQVKSEELKKTGVTSSTAHYFTERSKNTGDEQFNRGATNDIQQLKRSSSKADSVDGPAVAVATTATEKTEDDKSSIDRILSLQSEMFKPATNTTTTHGSFAARHNMAEVKFPTDGNVIYHQWSLAGTSIIIRCSYHGCLNPQGLVYLTTKMEYQPCFGFEHQTLNEIAMNWMSVYVRPNSSLIRARVNPYNSEVMMIENVQFPDLIPPDSSFSSSQAFTDLDAIFSQLKKLDIGQYVLKNEPKHDSVTVLKMTDEQTERQYDLYHDVLCDKKTGPHPVQWLPIDTRLLLPHHRKMSLVPGMYIPKDGPCKQQKPQPKPAKKKKKRRQT